MSTQVTSPGSRWESAWLALLLVADLLSIPFHLLVFTAARAKHGRAFRRALAEAGP